VSVPERPDWRDTLRTRVTGFDRRWAAAVTVFALIGLNFLLTASYENHAQAAQQHAGQIVESKLCVTLGSLAAEQPPPGNPAANPSRAYLQDLHARFIDLDRDLGCRKD
jgi:hypothetical protein